MNQSAPFPLLEQLCIGLSSCEEAEWTDVFKDIPVVFSLGWWLSILIG